MIAAYFSGTKVKWLLDNVPVSYTPLDVYKRQHMDTVFAKGTLEKNPFRIDENGNAHGPGVLDMISHKAEKAKDFNEILMKQHEQKKSIKL